MGDPCCAWSSSAASAPLFAEASQLSHPGFSSSVPSFAQRDALAAVDCNAGAPADNGGALEDMFYNPGETRLSERYQFHADIPAKETTYMQYTFNLPAEPSVRNVVGFQSIIECDALAAWPLLLARPAPPSLSPTPLPPLPCPQCIASIG